MPQSPSEAFARVCDAVDARREDFVGFLARLIAAGRGGESGVQAAFEAEARAFGCDVTQVAYQPADVPMIAEFASSRAIDAGERVSVVARRSGAGSGRSLILFAHPDSEPFVADHGWRHDPFAATIANGRLHGWGVADDLAGVAVLALGLRAVIEAGLAPAGDVTLASTPSKRHARGVSALLHAGLSADAAIYLHPAESGVGMREIKAFASGQLEFRIVVDGRPPDTNEPSHTAFSHRAINPLDKALILHRALRDLDARRGARIRHPLLERAVGRSTNLLVSHIACGEADRPSRIADACVMAGAVAFPPSETLAEVQTEIEDALRAAAAADDWLRDHPARIVWDSGVVGAETPADHPLYRAVADAVMAVADEAPFVNPMHTSSDIRNPIVQKGIPTVGLGPLCGDLTQNGRRDEWVDVADFIRAVKVAAGAIVTWCGAVER